MPISSIHCSTVTATAATLINMLMWHKDHRESCLFLTEQMLHEWDFTYLHDSLRQIPGVHTACSEVIIH